MSELVKIWDKDGEVFEVTFARAKKLQAAGWSLNPPLVISPFIAPQVDDVVEVLVLDAVEAEPAADVKAPSKGKAK